MTDQSELAAEYSARAQEAEALITGPKERRDLLLRRAYAKDPGPAQKRLLRLARGYDHQMREHQHAAALFRQAAKDIMRKAGQ